MYLKRLYTAFWGQHWIYVCVSAYIYNISVSAYIYNISVSAYIYNISVSAYIYNISVSVYIYSVSAYIYNILSFIACALVFVPLCSLKK